MLSLSLSLSLSLFRLPPPIVLTLFRDSFTIFVSRLFWTKTQHFLVSRSFSLSHCLLSFFIFSLPLPSSQWRPFILQFCVWNVFQQQKSYSFFVCMLLVSLSLSLSLSLLPVECFVYT